MTTQFYLADFRFMNNLEIELAKCYDDSAFLCSRHYLGKGKMKYSLAIPTISLYNLPSDTRIVNDNNVKIQTIEELLNSIGENGVIEHMEQRERKMRDNILNWLLSRPDLGGWYQFREIKKMVEKDPEKVIFLEKIGAKQYII